MIYNCRICGNDADWDEGHGCALGTPENERHRLTLKERDVARADLAAAQRTIEQLGKDAAALAAENERLKGELSEARLSLLEVVDCEKVTPDCHRRILNVLYPPAPPPAESTPVYRTEANCGVTVSAENSLGLNRELAKHAASCVTCQAIRGRTSLLAGLERARTAAPPGDIRERLEESLINRIDEAKSYVLGQIGRVERVFAAHSEEAYRRLADHDRRLAAMEAKGSDRCARADCGRPRRWGGHEGHHEFVAELEAKGEPGTHAKGEVR